MVLRVQVLRMQVLRVQALRVQVMEQVMEQGHYVPLSASGGSSGSMFQIDSAYSSIHLSLEKKPMRATLVMHLVSHSSWSR